MSPLSRYSLTLWQGESDPVTVEDLLFIRDHSSPEQIYYDIYEPVLSRFKDIACEYQTQGAILIWSLANTSHLCQPTSVANKTVKRICNTLGQGGQCK